MERAGEGAGGGLETEAHRVSQRDAAKVQQVAKRGWVMIISRFFLDCNLYSTAMTLYTQKYIFNRYIDIIQ